MGRKSKKLLNKINQLRNLRQYKNLSDEKLEQIALQKLAEEEQPKIEEIDDLDAEIERRIEEYKKVHHIETLAEIEQLKKLIYFEIHHERLQKMLSHFTETGNVQQLNYLTKTLVDVTNTITNLKKELGLLEEKKGESVYEYIQKLKKKFRLWMNENQASRHIICPHCSRQIILKIRTDCWEARKHPFFKDRIYYNEHLLRLYLAGKISKEDVAKVLNVSNDYVDWLFEKWVSRPDFERLKEEAEQLKKGVSSDDRENN